MNWAARLPPLAFAALVATAYVLLTLPILLYGDRDVSFFVVAGDYFVDPNALRASIFVRPNSFGYDGQFFYRLAVAPFSFSNPDAGIRFDVPVYRSQRFLYPLLAWIASAGQPVAAAAALFAVNVVAIFCLAAAALSLVRRLALPGATAWAIVAGPSLIVSLTHDTAEIVTVAFLLGALSARAHGRTGLFVLLGIGATLTRETVAPVFAGLLLWDLLALRRGGSWRLVLADGAAVVPLVALHAIMPILWDQTASEGVLAHNFGWPLLGLARTLAEKITALGDAVPGQARREAALDLIALSLLFTVAARATLAACRTLPRPPYAWLAAAWLPTALLMAGLSAGDGTFITPDAYSRAFSEFWPLSCLLIAAGSPARRPPLLLALGTAAAVLFFTYDAFDIAGFQ